MTFNKESLCILYIKSYNTNYYISKSFTLKMKKVKS